MKNASDGKSDGFALFYVKDRELFSVALTKEQLETFDFLLPMILKNKVTVLEGSQGKVTNRL